MKSTKDSETSNANGISVQEAIPSLNKGIVNINKFIIESHSKSCIV